MNMYLRVGRSYQYPFVATVVAVDVVSAWLYSRRIGGASDQDNYLAIGGLILWISANAALLFTIVKRVQQLEIKVAFLASLGIGMTGGLITYRAVSGDLGDSDIASAFGLPVLLLGVIMVWSGFIGAGLSLARLRKPMSQQRAEVWRHARKGGKWSLVTPLASAMSVAFGFGILPIYTSHGPFAYAAVVVGFAALMVWALVRLWNYDEQEYLEYLASERSDCDGPNSV